MGIFYGRGLAKTRDRGWLCWQPRETKREPRTYLGQHFYRPLNHGRKAGVVLLKLTLGFKKLGDLDFEFVAAMGQLLVLEKEYVGVLQR